MEQNIQWYPGHMAKARRMLLENLALIDVVVELVDARAPAATRNPDFDSVFAAKKRIVLLNKSDLADPAMTKRWAAHYEAAGIAALPLVSTANGQKKAALALMQEAAAPAVSRMKEKGVLKTVRVMVVGIPNVGKSTFINRIAGGQRAKTGDKPGVTRGKQWVKITPYLELMDTPGLLWPKLENPVYAERLAFLGSVNDEIMDIEALAGRLLATLAEQALPALSARYRKIEAGMEPHALLAAVAESRGFVLPGGGPDLERAARIALDEFRGGKIAKLTLDSPDETFPPEGGA